MVAFFLFFFFFFFFSFEKLLWLLLVVGFCGGYCDYGGGCWPVLWYVCLVVAGFFSLVPWLGLFGAMVSFFGAVVGWWWWW